MQSIIEKFLSNLVVAAFIPSIMFIVVISIILKPIVSPTALLEIENIFTTPGLFQAVVVIVVGFTLLYLREVIFSFYKGDFLPSNFAILERRRMKILKQKILIISNKVADLARKNYADSLSGENNADRIKLENALNEKKHFLEFVLYSSFPDSEEYILPTRFGNLLKAAENYPARRYGIDAVSIWPRLIHILPESNFQKVEEANNQLSFAINTSFLSLITSIILEVVSINKLINFLGFHSSIDSAAAIKYTLLALGFFFLFWLFYRASLLVTKTYTFRLCSMYDLFRFELLKQLHIALPFDSKEERDTWKMVSEWTAIGTIDLFFEYVQDENSKTPV